MGNGAASPEEFAERQRGFKAGNAMSMSRQASDNLGLARAGIVSLKLTEDGYLRQEETDLKIEVGVSHGSEVLTMLHSVRACLLQPCTQQNGKTFVISYEGVAWII